MSDLQRVFDELREMGTTLTRVDTNMTSLIGNGQPGRIGRIEETINGTSDEIKKHAAVINKIKGALIVIAFLLSLIGGSEAYVHLLK